MHVSDRDGHRYVECIALTFQCGCQCMIREREAGETSQHSGLRLWTTYCSKHWAMSPDERFGPRRKGDIVRVTFTSCDLDLPQSDGSPESTTAAREVAAAHFKTLFPELSDHELQLAVGK